MKKKTTLLRLRQAKYIRGDLWHGFTIIIYIPGSVYKFIGLCYSLGLGYHYTIGVGIAHPFGALQFTLSEHFSSPIVCSGVHVARSLFFCVVFCGSVCSIVLFLGEKHRPAASHWQTLSHNVVSSTPRHERDSKQTTDRIRITTVLRAEIDIITSISASPIEPAVILVIMSVETFNSDVYLEKTTDL
jgi:hypothetical protein